jgi:hypothetical protein
MTGDLQASMAAFQRAVIERDGGLAETVLDQDYQLMLVQPAVAVVPRVGWLAVLPDYVVDEYEVESEQVDVDGDTAAVLSRVRMLATVLGVDRSGVFVISDVWRRRDGGWMLWRRHSTPATAGLLPGG